MQDPKYVAESIRNIVRILISKMSIEAQTRAKASLVQKIKNFNVIEMSNKKSPGGASIVTSITVMKNILNSKDPYFINLVILELIKLGF